VHGDPRLFAFIVLRGLNIALKEHDDFTRLFGGGPGHHVRLQSIINMGVNLQLLPAKGMTLPFISYGGSSLIAMAISMGMVLALTRNRPEKRAANRACAFNEAPAGGINGHERHRSFLPPAAPAAISFPPRRWRMN
jgi:hypothetical protein